MSGECVGHLKPAVYLVHDARTRRNIASVLGRVDPTLSLRFLLVWMHEEKRREVRAAIARAVSRAWKTSSQDCIAEAGDEFANHERRWGGEVVVLFGRECRAKGFSREALTDLRRLAGYERTVQESEVATSDAADGRRERCTATRSPGHEPNPTQVNVKGYDDGPTWSWDKHGNIFWHKKAEASQA